MRDVMKKYFALPLDIKVGNDQYLLLLWLIFLLKLLISNFFSDVEDNERDIEKKKAIFESLSVQAFHPAEETDDKAEWKMDRFDSYWITYTAELCI